jgi:enoyl-[acyl-carrier-protein] reductase (NADH)
MATMEATEDVAHPVMFLCSDMAGFLTGQPLMVDGGASAVQFVTF